MRSHITNHFFTYALIAVLAGSLLSAGLPAFQQSYATHNNISIEIDEIEYDSGDDVVISGSIDDVNDDEDTVDIRITKAGGGSDNDEADVGSNGNFDFVYELANNADDGIYTVRVTYDSESVYSYFIVDEDTDDVAVVLDEESYDAGDDVEVSGEVDSVSGVDEVEITILDPSNDELLDSQDEDVDNDEFSHSFDLDDNAEHGRYAVTVTYDDSDEGYAIFEVNEDDTEPVTMTLSKTTYTPGATVRVTGEVADVVNNEEVEVVVVDSDDNEVFDDSVEPENDGSYEFEFDLEDDAEEGTYTVTVTYDGDDVEDTFAVSEGTSSGGSSSSGDITVALNKASYLAGETMTVTGKVPKMINNEVVNIDIFYPDGSFALITTSVEPASDLTFTATLKLKSDLDVDEEYSVKVNYGTYSGEKEFDITGASSSSSELTVKTDKSEYEIGSTVKITGTINSDSIVEGQKVLIRVNKPDGNPYRIDIVEPSSSGSYTYNVVIGGALATAGEYEVQVTYGEEEQTAEFELVGQEGTSYPLKVEGKSYPIEYEITGGDVKSMFVRPSDNTLVVSINAETDGQLVLVLPREVIDSVEEGSDKTYVVATADLEAGVGNDDVDIRESDTTDDARTIVIDYEAGTDLIEISGTSVVPEFPVSAIVLAVAIVGIIVATARTQKFSFFR
jgi:predicted secreted protein with PEFG-CTERM motif